jgi:hypothetical protein
MKLNLSLLAATAAGLIATPVFAQQAAAVPAEPTANANANPNTDVSPTQPRGLNRATGGHVLPDPDRSTPVGATIAGGLDSSHATTVIQYQDMTTRDRLVAELQQRINTATQQVNDLKSKGQGLQGEALSSFKAAWADYEKAKQRLDGALQAAKVASASGWDNARSALSTEYAFFASAVAGVEIAVPN